MVEQSVIVLNSRLPVHDEKAEMNMEIEKAVHAGNSQRALCSLPFCSASHKKILCVINKPSHLIIQQNNYSRSQQ